MYRPLLVALVLLTVAGTSLPTHARDKKEEMIVSVRKTEENLQDVPLSVTALPSLTLQRATVQQLSDVANLTPGLSFQDFNVGALSTPVIRGLAQSNTQGRENNVGMFLDGIYLPSRNNLDIELLDLERVEVTKGPQGALYGRSTFAGSINYVTKKPSDELDLKLMGSAGTDEYYEGQINLSGPLTETLSGSVGLAYREFDGTIENIADSDNLGGYENTSAIGKLLWDATEDLSFELTGYYTDRETDSAGIHNVEANCGDNGFGGFSYTCGNLPFLDPVSVNPLQQGGESDTTFLALTINWDLGAVNLVSVTGYTDSSWSAITDYDADAAGQPYATFDAMFMPTGNFVQLNNLFFNTSDDETFSQEFRVEGGSDRFQWLAGVYYTTEDFDQTASVTLSGNPLPPGETLGPYAGFYTTMPLMPNDTATESDGTTDIYAVFGRAQWNINDRNRLSIEARYTYEDKEINGIKSFFGAPTGVQSNDWDYITPRITYDFDLTDNHMLYASAAGGTKSGGFNTSYSLMFPNEQFYDEETNWTYELGTKGLIADGNVRYDLAIFYIDWEDLQISGSSEDPMFVQAIVRNTGSATSEGVEIQLDWTATDWMTLGGGYAYANPEFDNGVMDRSLTSVCGDLTLCTLDVGGQQLGRTVKNQLNLYADFQAQLAGDWNWYARADYIYRDKSPTRSANLQFVDEWNLVNARIGVASEHWDIAVWAKNLFDEEYVTSQIRQPRLSDFSRPTTVIQGNLRQVALAVTYRY